MHETHRLSVTICAAALTAAALQPLATAQAFQPGDLYLRTWVGGISSIDAGIVRIDPATGATQVIRQSMSSPSRDGTMTFDRYRGGLVMCGIIDPVNVRAYDTWLIDAGGQARSLGQSGRILESMAPDGRGKIYCHISGAPNDQVSYLDEQDQLQSLLDPTGAQPFRFAPTGTFTVRRMLYHAPTHSLIGASTTGATACGGGRSPSLLVYRTALSADGTRAVGPVTCAEFEVSPSGEWPVGLATRPDGRVLVTIDTNSGASEPRLALLDPQQGMTFTPFAWPDGAGAGALVGGVWSSRMGLAVVVDSGRDFLRGYSLGGTGGGTILTPPGAPVSPGGSSGEIADLVEIPPGFGCRGHFDRYGVGVAGSGGFVPQLNAVGCAEPGATITLHASDGLGGAVAALLLGSTRTQQPVLGGTLLVGAPTLLPITLGGTAGTPGQGRWSVSFTAGSPRTATLQLLTLDPAGPQGVAFSAGLELRIVAP